MSFDINKIRNFCIIAHIDHGKSTLADRLLQITKTVSERELKEQFLDDMDIERERGITIKAKAIRIDYKGYTLNLIDTPGHVDFSYEVSRSLSACEGALLVVDASQGVEAQTVANIRLARSQNLKIIPVINKIDIQSADIDLCQRQLNDVLKVDEEECLRVSAKSGKNINSVIDRIIEDIPAPQGDQSKPLQALVFDSTYNSYRGVIVYIRIVDGSIRAGMDIKFMQTGNIYRVEEVGVFKTENMKTKELQAGEVGYVVTNIKNSKDITVGDTITEKKNPCHKALPGFKKTQPMVFAGIYPVNQADYESLRDSLAKLTLNDSSLTYEAETSPAIGFGFRCGFLGMLHMEVIQERLEREYNLNLVTTCPNVTYFVKTQKGKDIWVYNPSQMPARHECVDIREPFIKAFIITTVTALGTIMKLAQERRGIYVSTEYMDENHAIIIYELPLSEVIYDFYDKLKSVTSGYGSLDYEHLGYRPSDLVRLDILVGGELVDAFSTVVHRSESEQKGRQIAAKLKELIPRQLFEIPLQAAIGERIVARETIRALKKNVTAKCYGGDITRKRKLWEKQKEGKKRMKQFGKVQIPQEAFMAVIKKDG